MFKQENKIIVRFETPGDYTMNSEILYVGEYNIIKIMGKKNKDIEPKNIEDNIFNLREYGTFFLEIPLKAEKYLLSNEDPRIESKKGITSLEFNLAKKKVKEYLPSVDEI